MLTLIAEGATNRQIGAALYMAEKTASVHVSRILTKLGVRSRTQAAAMAHRLHLTRVSSAARRSARSGGTRSGARPSVVHCHRTGKPCSPALR